MTGPRPKGRLRLISQLVPKFDLGVCTSIRSKHNYYKIITSIALCMKRKNVMNHTEQKWGNMAPVESASTVFIHILDSLPWLWLHVFVISSASMSWFQVILKQEVFMTHSIRWPGLCSPVSLSTLVHTSSILTMNISLSLILWRALYLHQCDILFSLV